MYPLRRKAAGLLLLSLLLASCFTTSVRSYYSLPLHKRFIVGEQVLLPLQLPRQLTGFFNVAVQTERPGILNRQGIYGLGANADQLVALAPGKGHLHLKLFGTIPLHRLQVEVLPPIQVIPGGQSIGVLVQTEGVLVVDQAPVIGEDTLEYFPAKNAGIQAGDVIISINGFPVGNDLNTAQLIDQEGAAGRPLTIRVKRQERVLDFRIQPQFCSETHRYRLGLAIRDGTAGVGTITFWHRDSMVYGALGHMINDVNLNQQLQQGKGRIVSAAVQGINQSFKGVPGEKIGVLSNSNAIFGTIDRNTPLGIYGKLYYLPAQTDAIPVAFKEQVVVGPAEILTVVQGNKIERFKVEIEKVLQQQYPSPKGLQLRITDPELLALTGGIVQGMSGSPIIQKGSLVGAVTHVLVNDPMRGYGVLAEWMLVDAGLVPAQQSLSNNNLAFYARLLFAIRACLAKKAFS